MRANTTPPSNSQQQAAAVFPLLLTRHEAAHVLATCLRTVDEAIASGNLEIVRIGRSVRIRPSALELFIEARTTRRNPRRSVGKLAKKETTLAQ